MVADFRSASAIILPPPLLLFQLDASIRQDRMGRAPGHIYGLFSAGARSWLNHGPFWARRTPPAVSACSLEIYNLFSTTWAHWLNFAAAEPPRVLRYNTEYYDVLPIDYTGLESLWNLFLRNRQLISLILLADASTVRTGRQLLRHARACVYMIARAGTYLGAP